MLPNSRVLLICENLNPGVILICENLNPGVVLICENLFPGVIQICKNSGTLKLSAQALTQLQFFHSSWSSIQIGSHLHKILYFIYKEFDVTILNQ